MNEKSRFLATTSCRDSANRLRRPASVQSRRAIDPGRLLASWTWLVIWRLKRNSATLRHRAKGQRRPFEGNFIRNRISNLAFLLERKCVFKGSISALHSRERKSPKG